MNSQEIPLNPQAIQALKIFPFVTGGERADWRWGEGV